MASVRRAETGWGERLVTTMSFVAASERDERASICGAKREKSIIAGSHMSMHGDCVECAIGLPPLPP